MPDFDFDRWAMLAERDPAAFFRARQSLIDSFIGGHPPRQAARLREMQTKIDCVRALAVSPGAAMRGITLMMEEQLEALLATTLRLLHCSADLNRAMRTMRSEVRPRQAH